MAQEHWSYASGSRTQVCNFLKGLNLHLDTHSGKVLDSIQAIFKRETSASFVHLPSPSCLLSYQFCVFYSCQKSRTLLIFSEDEFVVKEEESGDSDSTEMSEADLEVQYILYTWLVTTFHLCCGSGSIGSVCFRPPGSRSGFFYHQAKIVNLDFTFLRRFFFTFCLWKIM